MADRIPTFADICSAITEGSLAATIDGAMYAVNVLELRRYLNKFRSLPVISPASIQVRPPHNESTDTIRTSCA
jgi:hypothetical protein